MTLNEAIAKAKADGNVQLAEWLRQARGADAAARWYTEKLRDAHRTIRKLQNENTKLRELVRDMWRFTGAACKKYPRLFDPLTQGPQTVQFNPIETFEQRMQELGVEL